MISRLFSEGAKVPLFLPYVKLTTYTRQIFDCINTRLGRAGNIRNTNPKTVPQHAQLLKRLSCLVWRGPKRTVAAQEGRPVGIDADMSLGAQSLW